MNIEKDENDYGLRIECRYIWCQLKVSVNNIDEIVQIVKEEYR